MIYLMCDRERLWLTVTVRKGRESENVDEVGDGTLAKHVFLCTYGLSEEGVTFVLARVPNRKRHNLSQEEGLSSQEERWSFTGRGTVSQGRRNVFSQYEGRSHAGGGTVHAGVGTLPSRKRDRFS